MVDCKGDIMVKRGYYGYYRSNRGRNVLLCFVVFSLSLVSCARSRTENEEEIFVRANIAWHGQYDAITARLGEIWIGYIPLPGILAIAGTEGFAIKRVNYYHIKDGNLVFMGHVDITGMHDKNGNILKEAPRYIGSCRGRVVGINPSLIAAGSLAISFIVAPSEGIDHYWRTEIWADADIDIENASIKLRDWSRFAF